jgi:hypothetical protein
MAYRINEPIWERGHHGYMMTEYPHNAVNYAGSDTPAPGSDWR